MVKPVSPDTASRSPTTLQSTMDVAVFKRKDGVKVYRIVVTNSDGKQFVSDQSWETPVAAYAALREHLKELGVPDDQVTVSQVH